MIGIPEHMNKFQHLCKFGDLCRRFLEHDVEHCKHYTHLPLHVTEFHADDPIPSFSAAVFQTFQPRLSCCPRAGYRPHGGTAESADLRDRVGGTARHDDTVPVLLRGLSVFWTPAELDDFLRAALGPYLLPVSVDLIYSGPAETGSTGTAIVRMASHADAAALRRALNGRSFPEVPGGGAVTAEYVRPISLPQDATRPLSGLGRRRRRPGAATSCGAAVLRFHRAIRECGPYWADAEALFERMLEEGHSPDAAACRELLRCYRGESALMVFASAARR